MRQIVSKEKEAKRKKRNQIILGIILVGVMIASILSFAFLNQSVINPNAGTGTNSNQATYNGYRFVNQNGLWFLGNFSFTYLPQETENISSVVKPYTNYQGKPAYIYSEGQGAEVELTTNLGGISQRLQEACLTGTVCSGSIPVKTCNDNFIIIKESNSSSITQQDNCVYITGQQQDLVKLVDGFLYKTFGIKK